MLSTTNRRPPPSRLNLTAATKVKVPRSYDRFALPAKMTQAALVVGTDPPQQQRILVKSPLPPPLEARALPQLPELAMTGVNSASIKTAPYHQHGILLSSATRSAHRSKSSRVDGQIRITSPPSSASSSTSSGSRYSQQSALPTRLGTGLLHPSSTMQSRRNAGLHTPTFLDTASLGQPVTGRDFGFGREEAVTSLTPFMVGTPASIRRPSTVCPGHQRRQGRDDGEEGAHPDIVIIDVGHLDQVSKLRQDGVAGAQQQQHDQAECFACDYPEAHPVDVPESPGSVNLESASTWSAESPSDVSKPRLVEKDPRAARRRGMSLAGEIAQMLREAMSGSNDGPSYASSPHTTKDVVMDESDEAASRSSNASSTETLVDEAPQQDKDVEVKPPAPRTPHPMSTVLVAPPLPAKSPLRRPYSFKTTARAQSMFRLPPQRTQTDPVPNANQDKSIDGGSFPSRAQYEQSRALAGQGSSIRWADDQQQRKSKRPPPPRAPPRRSQTLDQQKTAVFEVPTYSKRRRGSTTALTGPAMIRSPQGEGKTEVSRAKKKALHVKLPPPPELFGSGKNRVVLVVDNAGM